MSSAYKKLWSNVFSALGLNVDGNLKYSLRDRDQKKCLKENGCETNDSKVKIGRTRSDTFASAKNTYFKSLK